MLKIEGLTVRFGGEDVPEAVSDVSLELKEREKIAIIGETGSGKSVLLMAILGMLPESTHIAGSAMLDMDRCGEKAVSEIGSGSLELIGLSQRELCRIRGTVISYVPQGSGNGMNPLLTVGYQVAEPLIVHDRMPKKKAIQRAVEALRFFDFGNEEKLIGQYPHQLSGGMRQRTMIAMGLAEGAPILFADEPTKGLDDERIRMVEDAFARLTNQAVLCVTHDLRFARVTADRIAVMYSSQIVEWTTRDQFFEDALHPYSKAMTAALPENGLHANMGFAPPREDENRISGCHFYDRCSLRSDKCRKNPPLIQLSDKRKVRCWRYE